MMKRFSYGVGMVCFYVNALLLVGAKIEDVPMLLFSVGISGLLIFYSR